MNTLEEFKAFNTIRERLQIIVRIILYALIAVAVGSGLIYLCLGLLGYQIEFWRCIIFYILTQVWRLSPIENTKK